MSPKAPRLQPREILSRNLRYLLGAKDWTETDAQRHTGVSQKTINNILNKTNSTTVDVIDRIAGAFGLKGWHLLLPNLPELYPSIRSTAVELETQAIQKAAKTKQ